MILQEPISCWKKPVSVCNILDTQLLQPAEVDAVLFNLFSAFHFFALFWDRYSDMNILIVNLWISWCIAIKNANGFTFQVKLLNAGTLLWIYSE